MKKVLLIGFIIWLGKLSGQVWSHSIDSTASPSMWFACGVEDTISHTLYLGGGWEKINNIRTKGIIKYNGTAFDSLQSGVDDQYAGINTFGNVRDMVMFQNKLYVCGNFLKTGKYYCNYLGRWNGASWDTVNFHPNGVVWYLKVYNNELYVGGFFDTIAGQHINNFAKFDGTTWHDIGYPFKTTVSSIENYKGKFYMSGATTPGSGDNLAVFDGTSWQPFVGVTGDNNKAVFGMKVIDTMLYVYGRFYSIAGTNCSGLAAWNGTKWFGYGTGVLPTSYATIRDITKINGDLYISGTFNAVDGVTTPNTNPNYVMCYAKFDVPSNRWCAVSPAFDNAVDFSLKYNNEQYIFGAFWHIGADSILKMAKWTGGNSTIACGTTVGVNEIKVSDNIKIFPNPATSLLNFSDEQNELQGGSIEITNSIGQAVINMPYATTIDVSGLSKGYYFILVKTSGQQILRSKFVKE